MNAFLKKGKTRKIPFCTAVIAAGGESSRMKGENKLFLEICGAPLLAHTLAVFESCEFVREIVVVSQNVDLERVRNICGEYKISKAVNIVVGGEERLDSVMNGVFAVSRKTKLIAIHDGARPCVTENIISQAVHSASIYSAAVPAVPVASTVKRAKDGIVVETIDRSELFEIQTPQVFDADMIKAALTNAKKKSIVITDDCMAVEALGINVRITEGSRENIKLTDRGDIKIVEMILRENSVLGVG